MENKTPMQELIDFLENNSLIDKKVLINRCKNLLEKEKQIIEDAYYSGFSDKTNDIYGIDYYNQKFKS